MKKVIEGALLLDNYSETIWNIKLKCGHIEPLSSIKGNDAIPREFKGKQVRITIEEIE